MRTDFHSHLYPKPYLDLMVQLGRRDYERAPAQDLDPAARIASQDEAGIDRQVISFVGLNSVIEDPAGAVDSAQCLNDVYAEVCASAAGRLLAFALLPLPHVDEAVEEVHRALARETCVGVALPCSIGGRPLDDPSFEALWAALDSLEAVVFIHPVGGDSSAHWGMAEFGLGAMFGSPMQIGLAATRLVLGGVTARYPRVRILLGQGGGFLAARWEAIENVVLRPGLAGHAPYMLGWVKDLDLDESDPMAGFRDLWIDTATMHQVPTLLDTVRATFGVERLVLGSDALFGSLTETVAFLQSTDKLSDSERADLLSGGARALVLP